MELENSKRQLNQMKENFFDSKEHTKKRKEENFFDFFTWVFHRLTCRSANYGCVRIIPTGESSPS